MDLGLLLFPAPLLVSLRLNIAIAGPENTLRAGKLFIESETRPGELKDRKHRLDKEPGLRSETLS